MLYGCKELQDLKIEKGLNEIELMNCLIDLGVNTINTMTKTIREYRGYLNNDKNNTYTYDTLTGQLIIVKR